MPRIASRMQMVELPVVRQLKLLLAAAIVLALIWIMRPRGDQHPHQSTEEEKYTPAIVNHTAQPIPIVSQHHPLAQYELPEEQDAAHEESIKWLIAASMKEDQRIDRAAAAERQRVISNIRQDHEQHGIDLEVLLERNHIESIPDLAVLRHRKFTSPTVMGSGILSIIRSLFASDPFDDVERVLDLRNDRPWSSDGNRITVFSTTNNISPYYVRLRMTPEADNQRVSLFGLRVEEDNIAIVQTFSTFFLGWYDLADCDRDGSGARYLPCVAANCASGYTFLMLLMEKVAIVGIEVYGRRSL